MKSTCIVHTFVVVRTEFTNQLFNPFFPVFQILGISERDFMDQMGVYFVNFVSQYGYDRVLSVLGRHMRDFLNGLDNLHEYLKFSYPLMRAPSFICENETRHGLTLHYRTKRKGFVFYTMGQIREVRPNGELIYLHAARRAPTAKSEVMLGNNIYDRCSRLCTFTVDFLHTGKFPCRCCYNSTQ